jgi:hypothetical protein
MEILHDIDGLAVTTVAIIDKDECHVGLCPMNFVVGICRKRGEGLGIRQL